MADRLMDYFNKTERIGTLSTADSNGIVDSAVFGSPRMIDAKTVVMGLGLNRTLGNLEKNPHAVFMIIEPGKTLADWKGIRVYLKVKALATSGELLDTFKAQMAKLVGKEAADMVKATVTFDVLEVRPLIDMGQGWEASI